MAHGTDDGKSITSIRHVQVGEQHVEALSRNKSQRSAHGGGGYHFKPAAFQAFLEHGADVVGVVRQQNSMFPHRRLHLSNSKDGRLEASNTAQYWTPLLFQRGVIREFWVKREQPECQLMGLGETRQLRAKPSVAWTTKALAP